MLCIDVSMEDASVINENERRVAILHAMQAFYAEKGNIVEFIEKTVDGMRRNPPADATPFIEPSTLCNAVFGS